MSETNDRTPSDPETLSAPETPADPGTPAERADADLYAATSPPAAPPISSPGPAYAPPPFSSTYAGAPVGPAPMQQPGPPQPAKPRRTIGVRVAGAITVVALLLGAGGGFAAGVLAGVPDATSTGQVVPEQGGGPGTGADEDGSGGPGAQMAPPGGGMPGIAPREESEDGGGASE